MGAATESRSIVLAVTGGVAAYKAAMVASRLSQAGHSLRVAMTPAATKFVGPATFAALTSQSVVIDVFDPAFPLGAHIQLARDYETLVVAPATANFLAKAASGVSDDLVTTLYLCFTGPVFVAPAMNVEMWNHVAVQRNIQQLKQDGVHFVEPEEGWLSCRVQGKGRMAEPETIMAAVVGS